MKSLCLLLFAFVFFVGLASASSYSINWDFNALADQNVSDTNLVVDQNISDQNIPDQNIVQDQNQVTPSGVDFYWNFEPTNMVREMSSDTISIEDEFIVDLKSNQLTRFKGAVIPYGVNEFGTTLATGYKVFQVQTLEGDCLFTFLMQDQGGVLSRKQLSEVGDYNLNVFHDTKFYLTIGAHDYGRCVISFKDNQKSAYVGVGFSHIPSAYDVIVGMGTTLEDCELSIKRMNLELCVDDFKAQGCTDEEILRLDMLSCLTRQNRANEAEVTKWKAVADDLERITPKETLEAMRTSSEETNKLIRASAEETRKAAEDWQTGIVNGVIVGVVALVGIVFWRQHQKPGERIVEHYVPEQPIVEAKKFEFDFK